MITFRLTQSRSTFASIRSTARAARCIGAWPNYSITFIRCRRLKHRRRTRTRRCGRRWLQMTIDSIVSRWRRRQIIRLTSISACRSIGVGRICCGRSRFLSPIAATWSTVRRLVSPRISRISWLIFANIWLSITLRRFQIEIQIGCNFLRECGEQILTRIFQLVEWIRLILSIVARKCRRMIGVWWVRARIIHMNQHQIDQLFFFCEYKKKIIKFPVNLSFVRVA